MKTALTMTKPELIYPEWAAPANVTAYSTTRLGGISEGQYQGLNVGMHVGDDPQHVQANRNGLPGADKLVWLNQVHGTHCKLLSTTPDDLPADASISRSTAKWCAVMTADCVPILLCDRDGSEVAAIHAGWQGLAHHIIGGVIATMQSAATDLIAWIGPAISGPCYQVDATLAARFKDFPAAISADPVAGKFRLDLNYIAAAQLSAAGVSMVTQSGLCTYRQPHQFYSHRYAQHHHATPTGRIVTVIGLT